MKRQTVVVALGGNALLRRGQALEQSIQRENIEVAVKAILEISKHYNIVLVHGNGPQVGLLALQGLEYKKVAPYTLDVLVSETQGMIGYMLMQELTNQMPEQKVTCVLTQMTVDPMDTAFNDPTKPIGPIYEEEEARELAEKYLWTFKPDGDYFRRVVPSPAPIGIIEHEAITHLINEDHLVICTGGGGIPVMYDDGKLIGVEAVIDKDMSAALLAGQINADALLVLTDSDSVYLDWGKPTQRALRATNPAELAKYEFEEGSMKPKIEASCEFIKQGGKVVGIGSLKDGLRILEGTAGTNITNH
ncbi:carbamate kinase [Vibrio hippocampi]|uniref:Carbamate kinase n=1 Tax=Vibrio hippocampi TaxID=654686 RepID=A0ABN8DMW4_9VIBR|nr:carbamate kinase [Vibrio hippocampi]CAH0529809.1 Carbamate kinase 1 [Vibrio hippocampi]